MTANAKIPRRLRRMLQAGGRRRRREETGENRLAARVRGARAAESLATDARRGKFPARLRKQSVVFEPNGGPARGNADCFLTLPALFYLAEARAAKPRAQRGRDVRLLSSDTTLFLLWLSFVYGRAQG